MKISQILENTKKSTDTKTKVQPDLSAFQDQFQDRPLQRVEPEQPVDEPRQPSAVNLPRATQADTLRATSAIQPNQRMSDLLSRMRDIEGGEEDEGYPTQEVGTDLTVRTASDIPMVVGNAMATAGLQNPDWHTVANLPGNIGASIRRLGKELFKSFTRTPTNNITMIGNVMGQGPNTGRELNAVAKWLMTNGKEVSSGDIDFEQSIPGYTADILVFDAAGARFLIVKDEFGRYIYTWPQQDSIDAPQQTPQLTRDVPRLNEQQKSMFERTLMEAHCGCGGMLYKCQSCPTTWCSRGGGCGKGNGNGGGSANKCPSCRGIGSMYESTDNLLKEIEYHDTMSFDVDGWKYIGKKDVEDDDTVKIYHTAISPEGKRFYIDFTPYDFMDENTFNLWVKLGMPKRTSMVPLNKDDIEMMAQKRGIMQDQDQTQTEWIASMKAQYPNVKFKEDEKTTRIVAYVNGLPIDEFDGQMNLFN